MRFVIHDAASGAIKRFGTCHPAEVENQEVPAGHAVLTLPDDHPAIDDTVHQVVAGAVVARTPAALDPAELLRRLRRRRDHRLAASDWTQLPDVPLPVEIRVRWAAYRQQLRDLPATTPDPASPPWPTPPSK